MKFIGNREVVRIESCRGTVTLGSSITVQMEVRGNVRFFSLETEHGMIFEQHDLENHVVNFYKSLFGSTTDNNIHIMGDFWDKNQQINEQRRAFLIKDCTEEEMRGVVFNMKLDTAPGPNGFGVALFRNFWDVIKGEIVDTVKNFQKGNLDIKRLNYGVITLLPKLAGATNIKQFRPICLLNVDYKLFTKLMTDRISSLKGQLIKQQQTTFVKGRNILEGVLTLHEVVHELKQKRRHGSFLKLILIRPMIK